MKGAANKMPKRTKQQGIPEEWNLQTDENMR